MYNMTYFFFFQVQINLNQVSNQRITRLLCIWQFLPPLPFTDVRVERLNDLSAVKSLQPCTFSCESQYETTARGKWMTKPRWTGEKKKAPEGRNLQHISAALLISVNTPRAL